MAIIGVIVDYNLDSAEFKDFIESLIPAYEAGIGDHLKNARTLFDVWAAFEESEFIVHIERLALAVLSAGFLSQYGITFTTVGYSDMEADKHRKKFNKKYSLVRNIGESILYMAERGYMYFLTGDIKETIFHGSKIHQYFKEVDEYKTFAARDPNDFNTSQEKIIEVGKVLLTKGRTLKAGHAQMLVNKSISDIERIISTFERSFNATQDRKLPWACLIYGQPGIAKSSVANMVFGMYHSYSTAGGYNKGLEWGINSKYVRNFNEKHWNGYVGQWAVLLDDLGFEHIKQLNAGSGRSLNELIQACNEVGFSTDQAALEDKGKRPFRGRCIVGTSNKEHLNAYHAVSTPQALQRRLFRKIHPVVKEKYRKPNSYQMEHTENPSMDSWDFFVQELYLDKNGDCINNHIPGSVEREVIIGGEKVNKKIMSGEEFAAYIKNSVLRHEAHCERMFKFNHEFVGLCKHEVYKHVCTKCELEEDLKIEKQPVDFPEESVGYEIGDVIHQEAYYHSIPLATWYLKTKMKCKYWLMRFGFFSSWWKADDVRNMLDYYTEQTRAYWKEIIAGVCVFSLCATFAMYASSDQKKEVEEKQFEPASSDMVEKENIWTNDAVDFTDVIGAPRTVTAEDLVKCLEKSNVFQVCITSSKGARNLHALGLYGQWFVTTAHGFQDGGDQFGISLRRGPMSGVSLRDEQIYFIRNSQIRFNRDKDLAFFKVPGFRPVRDIRKFILPGMLMEAGYATTVTTRESFYTRCYSHPIRYDGQFQGTPTSYRNEWILADIGKVGDCGAPVVFHHPQGNFIAGVIACASTHGAGFQPLILDDIPVDQCISDAGFSYITSEAERIGKVTPLHGKALSRHVQLEGRALALGSFPAILSKPNMRTRVSKVAQSFLDKFGGEIEHGTPIARGRMVDGVYKSPELRALQRRSNTVTKLDNLLYSTCAKEYAQELADGFDLEQIFPVSQDIALNGIEGDPWVNKIDRSTSAGVWAPGAKRRQLVEKDGTYVLNDFMQGKLDDLLSRYRKWERAHVLFDAHLKDEALPWKKVHDVATRVFMCCSLEFSICVRMVTIMFAKQFMIHNSTSECFVGVNCYKDWGTLKNHLTRGGLMKFFGDGDYKEYDTGMAPFEMMIAFEVIQWVCMASGNFEGFDCIFNGIAVDCSFPNVRIAACLVMFFGSNMSGHPLTVIINSIVNSIRMRYAYVMITKASVSRFRAEIALATYGDDNAYGTIQVEFNHHNLQAVFASCGIKYTDASKSEDDIGVKKIGEISFLKRTFVDSDHGVLCPIEFKTIRKMITVITPSKKISEDEQLAEIIESANREMSLHGQTAYENAHAKFDAMVEEFPEIKQWMLPRFYEDWETQLKICRGEWHPDEPDVIKGVEASDAITLAVALPFCVGLSFVEHYQNARVEEYAKEYTHPGFFVTTENLLYYKNMGASFWDRVPATIMHFATTKAGLKMGTFWHAVFNTLLVPIPSPMAPLHLYNFLIDNRDWKPSHYAQRGDTEDNTKVCIAALYCLLNPVVSVVLYPDVWDYYSIKYVPTQRAKAIQVCLKAKTWLDTVITPSWWDQTTTDGEKRVSRITEPSSSTPIQGSSRSEEQQKFDI